MAPNGIFVVDFVPEYCLDEPDSPPARATRSTRAGEAVKKSNSPFVAAVYDRRSY